MSRDVSFDQVSAPFNAQGSAGGLWLCMHGYPTAQALQAPCVPTAATKAGVAPQGQGAVGHSCWHHSRVHKPLEQAHFRGMLSPCGLPSLLPRKCHFVPPALRELQGGTESSRSLAGDGVRDVTVATLLAQGHTPPQGHPCGRNMRPPNPHNMHGTGPRTPSAVPAMALG